MTYVNPVQGFFSAHNQPHAHKPLYPTIYTTTNHSKHHRPLSKYPTLPRTTQNTPGKNM